MGKRETVGRKGGLFLCLFGLPFIGAGGYFALAGFGYIPLHGKANAPLWVIGCVGLAFLAAGLAVSGAGIAGFFRASRNRDTVRLYPNEPWLLDHAWEREGIRSAGLVGVIGGFAAFGFYCVFLAPFHYWAWISDEGSLFVRIITSVFELIALFVGYRAVRGLIHWFKFGRTFLLFDQFPFHPGEKLKVEFGPNKFDSLDVVLRFRRRTTTQTGSGDNRHTRVDTDTIYQREQRVECHALDPTVVIEFGLPAQLDWVNRISENPSFYWEMEISADVLGVDFEESYKLPVYAPITGDLPARGKRRPRAAAP